MMLPCESAFAEAAEDTEEADRITGMVGEGENPFEPLTFVALAFFLAVLV